MDGLKRLLLATLVTLVPASQAFAGSHSYANMMRSSINNHVFVQQSVDGEFGTYEATGSTKNAETGEESPLKATQKWKGYGIGTTAGLEMMKFVQVHAGHTFVNMRYKDDAQHSLSGSRLNAGMRLVFSSPVVNLEGGAGLLGSRLDYQRQLENASFYGSGVYYSLGLNYFLDTRFSFYYEAKLSKEHLVQNSGAASVQAIDTDTTMMGLGFRIWM